MSTVYFDPAVGGDGSTVTDDSNATTGLRNYGWTTRFVPSLANLVNVARTAVSRAVEATAAAASAYLYSQAASANASASSASAQAASASAASAGVYASQAQATNPDSPIRLNPRRIDTDFAVAAGYNAASVGPIAVAEGVAVTVQDNATWSIH